MSATKNLWPEFKPEKLVSPKTLMIEQANFLSESTKKVLIGEVSSNNIPGKKDQIVHTFKIVAPTLNNYKFALFTVQHGLMFYPLSIIFQGKREILNEENALINKMREIFNDEHAQRIVQSLYSQSIS